MALYVSEHLIVMQSTLEFNSWQLSGSEYLKGSHNTDISLILPPAEWKRVKDLGLTSD